MMPQSNNDPKPHPRLGLEQVPLTCGHLSVWVRKDRGDTGDLLCGICRNYFPPKVELPLSINPPEPTYPNGDPESYYNFKAEERWGG